jgi:hypothetical protein
MEEKAQAVFDAAGETFLSAEDDLSYEVTGNLVNETQGESADNGEMAGEMSLRAACRAEAH